MCYSVPQLDSNFGTLIREKQGRHVTSPCYYNIQSISNISFPQKTMMPPASWLIKINTLDNFNFAHSLISVETLGDIIGSLLSCFSDSSKVHQSTPVATNVGKVINQRGHAIASRHELED